MAARIQILRSGTPGSRPSGKQYGEPYVNVADNQFGVFDSSNVARDLLGVRMFSSSISYVIGNVVNNAGKIYKAISAVSPGAFNATQWSEVASLANIPAAPGLVFLNALTASNSATLVDTTSITSTYNEYEIIFQNIIPSITGTSGSPNWFRMQVNTAGGLQTTGYSSQLIGLNTLANSSSMTMIGENEAGAVMLTGSGFIFWAPDSIASTGISGKLSCHNITNSGQYKFFTGQMAWSGNSGGNLCLADVYSCWKNASPISGLTFMFQQGNIVSGEIIIFGRKTS